MISDNKNLRQISLDFLGKPPHVEEHEGRHSAPGSCVHRVGLKIISQSGPRLSRAPPRFCPGCSLYLECLSLSSCEPVFKGSADELPPLTAPAEVEAVRSGSTGLHVCHSWPRTPGA